MQRQKFITPKVIKTPKIQPRRKSKLLGEKTETDAKIREDIIAEGDPHCLVLPNNAFEMNDIRIRYRGNDYYINSLQVSGSEGIAFAADMTIRARARILHEPI